MFPLDSTCFEQFFRKKDGFYKVAVRKKKKPPKKHNSVTAFLRKSATVLFLFFFWGTEKVTQICFFLKRHFVRCRENGMWGENWSFWKLMQQLESNKQLFNLLQESRNLVLCSVFETLLSLFYFRSTDRVTQLLLFCWKNMIYLLFKMECVFGAFGISLRE